MIAVHPANWRLLQAAAESYLLLNEHFGSIVAGKFHRGQQRRAAGSARTSAIAPAPSSSWSPGLIAPAPTPIGARPGGTS